MEEEAAPFLEAMANPERLPLPDYKQGPLRAFRGHLFGNPLGDTLGAETVVAVTGIGLANAALAAALLIPKLQPRAYILAGTTGGLASDVRRGDWVAGASAVFHNADASAFGYVPGQIPGMPALVEADPELVARARELSEQEPIRVGLVGSSNSFVAGAQVEQVRDQFPDLLAVDMETAAAGQVCNALGCPWISLRAVSDLADAEAAEDFDESAPAASSLSFNLVEKFLEG